MEPLEDEFGDIIQKARTGLGLTITQLSDSAGIPAPLLEEMESYRHLPSEEEVRALAKALSLDAVKLFAIAKGEWHPEGLPPEGLSNVATIDGTIGSYPVKGYLLLDQGTGEAAAFDTANSGKEVLQCLKEKGCRLKYIFITHCHRDHVGGLEEICRVSGAVIGIPEGEAEIEFGKGIGKEIIPVKDNSEFKLGSETIKALATPGHTHGSTCYVTQDYCFAGDTLFAGSVGRAYGPEGYRSQLRSVRERILSLNDGVRLFPGHGPATTVGEERGHNPFF